MDRALLRELVRVRRNGAAMLFEVTAEGVATRIVIAQGHVVSVEESGAGEPLGRVLVRKRLLTQEQYVDVLEKMSDVRVAGEKLRFAETAVGLGYITEAQARSALTEQIRGRAMRTLSRRRLTWTATVLGPNRDASRDLALSLEAIVLDALRLTDDEVKESLALESATESALVARWPIEEIDAAFELTSEEAAAVRKSLGGTRVVSELLAEASADVDIHALLTALLVTGAAEERPRAKKADPLGAATAPSRERAAPPPLPEWATIEAARAKGAVARTQSGPPPAEGRDEVAEVEKRLRAEQAFQRGKALVRQGRSREASAELERARTLDPSSAEYALHAAWAARAESKEAPSSDEALKLGALADRALAVAPSLAFGHFVRGELARARGDEEGARRHLRHALRLEPGLFASERAIRVAALRTRTPSAPILPAPAPIAAPANAPAPEPAPAPAPANANANANANAPANAPAPAPANAPAPAIAPPPAPRRSRAPYALLATLLALTAFAGAALLRPHLPPPSPDATRTEVLAAQPPSPPPSAPSPPAPAPAPAPEPSLSPAPSLSPSPSPSPSPPSSTGTLLLPAWTTGHRVILDAKPLGDATPRMDVPCGRHTLRIGRSGRDAQVTIPCGGELPFTPPRAAPP